jgi:hypothetical protein
MPRLIFVPARTNVHERTQTLALQRGLPKQVERTTQISMAGLYRYQNKYRYILYLYNTGTIENGSILRYNGIISYTTVAVYSRPILPWIRGINAGAWNAR